MKIRYYKRIDGWRWLGFLLAMIGAFILSNADVQTQWMGWAIATMSCSIWIYMGISKNGDGGGGSIFLLFRGVCNDLRSLGLGHNTVDGIN